ncbi:acyl-CoA thioesterase/BAAT N-terminal domain-containing protein [Cellulomonas cellasea]|uniref:Dienelactone hydrolase n=1 Tax=Cellulomonas cellasea TaxID=43670 RepID=A0A7W4UBN8_9CELL|nr:acyl-CoA thioesterase/BAAT N-terminal domain-containing protein [Cellulomonas cellasea]MBB2921231.1 dienelactone hydrolase [Cellulomonas cellasea]
MHRSVAVGAAVVAVAGLVLAGCTPGPEPAIHVEGSPDRFLDPVHVTLTGLPPGEDVQVRSEVRSDLTWTSSATYTADDEGRVDLDTATPRDAPFDEPDGTGLFWTLAPAGAEPAAAEADTWFVREHTVRLTARVDGEDVASADLHRLDAVSQVRVEPVEQAGIVGRWAVPAAWDGTAPDGPVPAVLVFGGSEGGIAAAESEAAVVAYRGYPALAISYFGSPGQPATLDEVPVETFLRALDWLRAQPGVDPERILTYGTSRGGEMALWLAAHRPDLVHGAIAPVGAHALMCSPDDCGPAWSLGGEPLEHLGVGSVSDYPPGDVPEGSPLVPVEDIRGPVVLACGGQDALWSSCTYAVHASTRLDDLRPGDHELVYEPDADHYVASAPMVPWGLDDPATAQATHRARLAFSAALDDALRRSVR